MTLPTGDTAPTPPRHENLAPYDTFADRVRELCVRPGAQQALRAGLGRSMDDMPGRTHAALLRNGLVPDGPGGSDRKRAYYAVAALIAARPRAERRTDDRDDRDRLDAAAQPDTTDPADIAAPADTAAPPDTAADPDTATHPGAAGRSAGAEASSPPASGTVVDAEPPTPTWGTSLGASLAGLTTRRARSSDGAGTSPATQPDKVGGVEQRLHLLVRQDIDGVHRMLPPLVRQLGSAGIAVDYGRLLRDLLRWPHRHGEVTTRWLEDYYRTLRRSERPS
ncbi:MULTISPECIES: type I-E CRISPR-associated protein Cse2/CasB [unclassified Streptomyces]|uniref:type I-E CRISPR-associated protein Cse2/CasB n=1 Tax=unclassified Streptomyces TaxID=2593676 RepID=UPI00382FA07A